MKEYTLPYGSGCQKVMLPEEHILYDIHGNKASVAGDIKEATLNALRSPVESAPLKDVVQKGDKVAVIVSDITRLVRTADFCLLLLMKLMQAACLMKISLLLLQQARTVPIHRRKMCWFAGRKL